ncbi:hypothetical protein [Pelagicoccus sp. SDUM812002]|uniref:hypothetical protein n=1 Tax=Pelagicoccus sp. SDUM812002 TaxID=3041266 RepID=UPI00280E34A9|nr:hypothetical protein [Pelagicoccus sp. SDUM812002]MDQ8185662.1 hypothetical protein [Pelagicoccus sp. SDUM812002]
MDENESQLNNLSVAHYAVGALTVVFACMPLFYMAIGLFMVFGEESFLPDTEQVPPEFIGWFFFGMGLIFFLLGQATAGCVIASGRYLKQRKNYTFSFVVACFSCAIFPFGTILGVFTIIVLSRDAVKRIYGRL